MIRGRVKGGALARTLGLALATMALIGIPAGTAAARSAPVVYYPLPSAVADPQGITAGPGGTMWFTEQAAGKVGEISPSGAIREFGIPTPDSSPEGIAAAPDGYLWITESSANKVAKVSPSGAIKQFSLPTAGSDPDQITIGPDGDPWFTESAGNRIGTVRRGTVVQYRIPTTSSDPQGLTVGPDGALHFTEAAVHEPAASIGTISTSGTITQTGLPTVNGTSAIAFDPAGNLWLIQDGSPTGILVFPAGGTGPVTEYFLPEANEPAGLTIGPDGDAWFAEAGSGQIARATWSPSGGEAISQYLTGGSPQGIATGPGDALWFTDPARNAIGRVALTPPAFTSPASATLTSGEEGKVTVTSTGFPTPALMLAGTLPGHMTFTDNGDGTATISGTPLDANAGMTFPVVVTADNGMAPSAYQTLVIQVAPAPLPAAQPPGPYGVVIVSRVRRHRTVVRVTVECSGTVGQVCAIAAKLTKTVRARAHAARRHRARILATRLITMVAGHRRTLRLRLSRRERRALARSRYSLYATLTIEQLKRRSTPIVLRRAVVFPPGRRRR